MSSKIFVFYSWYIQGIVAITYSALLKLFDMIERDNNLCERYGGDRQIFLKVLENGTNKMLLFFNLLNL